jgi:lipopolysaccharide/colanic/teichoic acid biosynthesis glycosyltransferase
VTGSLVLLVLTAPLVLLSALVSAACLRAWPFFVQERTGLHGQPFRLVKIRTLAPSTPTTLEKHHLEDYRPPAPCRFLRSHHLDELPQLLQVLQGKMSLVGPRPEMVALQDALPPELARARAQVRPGITGLWQVSTGVKGMIGENPEYDLWYVEETSARLDLWILWRTACGALGQARISGLDTIPAWARRVPAHAVADTTDTDAASRAA